MQRAMAAQLWKPGSACVLGANDLGDDAALVFEHGGRANPSDASLAAGRLFDAARSYGAKTLVVEDDLRRRGDPHLERDAVFLDDRVLHSAEIDGSVDGAVQLLRTGAPGYPLNAFLCDRSKTDLGLIAGRQIDRDQAVSIVAATQVVIVSVYDAEAYLAWLPPDWQ
jgi:hypothetical protein